MSKYSSVVAKNGTVYYYKIENGKKTRVPKSSVSSVPLKKGLPDVGGEDVSDETIRKNLKAFKKLKAAKAKSTMKGIIKKASPEIDSGKSNKSVKIKKKVTFKLPKAISTVKPPKIIIFRFGRGVAYPNLDGFKNYPIHSKGARPWKELSPFLIGPVEFINSDGEKDSCPIFENYWQSFKVWKNVSKQNQKKPEWVWPAEKHLGKDGNPNSAWYKWHDALCRHQKPVRRPNGKAIPEYAWWMNEDYEKLDTVESRKSIYIPILKKLYRAHPVYKKMLSDFRKGQNMVLIEPDGPWDVAYPKGREVTLDLLYELIEKMNYAEEGYPKQYCPYGHGYVAATCLLEDF
jgi:hypothetical protein